MVPKMPSTYFEYRQKLAVLCAMAKVKKSRIGYLGKMEAFLEGCMSLFGIMADTTGMKASRMELAWKVLVDSKKCLAQIQSLCC